MRFVTNSADNFLKWRQQRLEKFKRIRTFEFVEIFLLKQGRSCLILCRPIYSVGFLVCMTEFKGGESVQNVSLFSECPENNFISLGMN